MTKNIIIILSITINFFLGWISLIYINSHNGLNHCYNIALLDLHRVERELEIEIKEKETQISNFKFACDAYQKIREKDQLNLR